MPRPTEGQLYPRGVYSAIQKEVCSEECPTAGSGGSVLAVSAAKLLNAEPNSWDNITDTTWDELFN